MAQHKATQPRSHVGALLLHQYNYYTKLFQISLYYYHVFTGFSQARGFPSSLPIRSFSRFFDFHVVSLLQILQFLLGAIQGKNWALLVLIHFVCVCGSVGLRNADLVWPWAFILGPVPMLT